MTEYMPGGRRRIDRVLESSFIQGLESLPLEEIRTRRADADQEEVDLSYARRMLQGRIDMLSDERKARAAGGGRVFVARSDEELAQELGKILADPGGRSTHGMGRHLSLTPSRVGEHRRAAERAVADVGSSDPSALDDVKLEAAVNRLVELEGRVSSTRRAVQQVADLLGAEIARRYEMGEVEAAPVA
jgi:hypothetical protein